MQKRTVALLIVITSLAMAGIIVIQVYWVKNALHLQEEQFDNKVQVTLKSVVNRMFDARDSLAPDPSVCDEHCDHRTYQVLSAINPLRLDSLLQEEFGGMEISREYYWGVYNPACGSLFAGEAGPYHDKLINTNHFVSLSCLYQREQLMLGVYFPSERGVLWLRIFPYLLLALVLLAIVIFAFSFTIFSFLRQKKLSEMKSDFVNNMTHEFKTPIATISLASEMLLNNGVSESVARTRRYARIIHDENQRLKQQVEQVLQIAVLDKGQYRLKIKTFVADDAVKACIKSFELTVRDKGGMITYKPETAGCAIKADYHHFTNMVNNLLDNAAKYSREYPEIMVSTGISGNMFFVGVQDKGIGISHENLKHIFRNLYRVPTGNVHDVKGFGLGLFYVKTMAEAHGGYVKVSSELNKGSTFVIYIPIDPKLEISRYSHESESEDIAG
ncbi:MAG: HAMP domain-containing histidine kinase [Lentimicrobium sp.]|jgi:two-component system phosphate regulon sensor histidine kinase PhoR|nr:HAMP domain-containing histidine kinase [Lentimicrobium sp.]